MFFKMVSLNFKNIIQETVSSFMSFDSQKMGVITRNMYDFYKQIMFQMYLRLDSANTSELTEMVNLSQALLTQIPSYLQVSSPIAFPENGFFPQRGYSRGRENQEAFLSFLDNARFRLNEQEIDTETIFVNRRFTDNFQNGIKLDISELGEEDASINIKDSVKRLFRNTSLEKRNGYFIEFIFSKDKELAIKQKKHAVDILTKYLKGFQFKNYDLFAFEYGELCGLKTFNPLLSRGEFEHLKSLLSRHGAVLDVHAMAQTFMREAKPERPAVITSEQLRGAAEFYANLHNTQLDKSLDSLEQQCDVSSNDIKSLDEVQFVRHLYSSLINQIISEIRSQSSGMSEFKKEVAVGILKRIEGVLEDSNNLTRASTKIKQERLKYLLIAEELAIFHAVFNSEKTLEGYLAKDEFLNVQGIRRTPFVYNSGMSALSEIIHTLKPRISTHNSAIIDNNVYYEMPDMIQDLFGEEPARGDFSSSNGFNGDMAFFDLHPNNPNSVLIKNVPVQKIVDDISQIDFGSRTTPFSLVIDVSTHGMYDGEVMGLLKTPVIEKLIKENKLVVVTLQSLAKFGSMGTDKFNGAVVNVYDSGDDEFVKRFEQKTKNSNIVRGSVADRYFNMLFSLGADVHAEFVSRARSNASLLYKMVREINSILYGDRPLKFLQENQDPELIYVSLKYAPYFTPYMKEGVVSERTQKSLFYHLSVYLSRAKNKELLVNTRSGFGFVESAVSCCGESLRFMLGAGESGDSLIKYADMLLTVEKTLNDNISVLVDKNKKIEEFLSGECIKNFQGTMLNKYSSIEEMFKHGDESEVLSFIKLTEKATYDNGVKQKDILFLELQRLYYFGDN